VIVRTHHYEFEVMFVDKASPEWVSLPAGVEDTDSGYTDFDHERIVIRADMTTAMQADCLLHEVLHCAVEAGGGDDGVKNKGEAWVLTATAGLKQMLVLDNDELFEYLGVNL